jgi:hypothetical protein
MRLALENTRTIQTEMMMMMSSMKSENQPYLESCDNNIAYLIRKKDQMNKHRTPAVYNRPEVFYALYSLFIFSLYFF